MDREIKTRKQTFGIEIYDLMDELENDDQLPAADKETKIRSVFDAARKDIAVIQAKKDCKKEVSLLVPILFLPKMSLFSNRYRFIYFYFYLSAYVYCLQLQNKLPDNRKWLYSMLNQHHQVLPLL